MITPGQERCLYVFPDAEFARLFEGIRQAPVTSKRARDYQRMFLARASAETPDKQGRVTVPPDLRAYAGLSKDCVVIGAGTRVEVWDAEAWTTYPAEQEGAFADLSEEVLPGADLTRLERPKPFVARRGLHPLSAPGAPSPAPGSAPLERLETWPYDHCTSQHRSTAHVP